MTHPVTIIGAPASPYVRKVLAVLELKRVPYRLDPVVPFFGTDEFTRLSPLRRVPVVIDGDLVLPDSTVICEYLDERHPTPPLMPRDPAARARARWLEEFADTRMGDVLRLGGFLVAPAEIESTLLEVPGLADAQAIAVPGPSGARAVAFVIMKPGAVFDEAASIAHCRGADRPIQGSRPGDRAGRVPGHAQCERHQDPAGQAPGHGRSRAWLARISHRDHAGAVANGRRE